MRAVIVERRAAGVEPEPVRVVLEVLDLVRRHDVRGDPRQRLHCPVHLGPALDVEGRLAQALPLLGPDPRAIPGALAEARL